MKKTYRIKNKGRFITFVTIIMLIISMAIGALFPAVALSENSGKAYFEVCVKDGDTLWSLAKEHGSSNMDIREFIYEICALNNIDAASLMVGSYVKIPK